MEKIYALTDKENEKLMELTNEGWDKYYEKGRENERTAFRKAFQFCARRGISEKEFWDWVND